MIGRGKCCQTTDKPKDPQCGGYDPKTNAGVASLQSLNCIEADHHLLSHKSLRNASPYSSCGDIPTE